MILVMTSRGALSNEILAVEPLPQEPWHVLKKDGHAGRAERSGAQNRRLEGGGRWEEGGGREGCGRN